MNRKVYFFLISVVALILLITIGKLAYPNATSIVLNIAWFFFLSVVVVFFTMGVLVILGMKKNVVSLLDVFLEGSFSILDFFNFLKEVWKLFISHLKELILLISPIFLYILALSAYLLLLYLYKLVGKYYDITLLSVLLTVLMVGSVGLFNLPSLNQVVKTDFKSTLGRKMKTAFADALEVVIFIFFLTMDRTNLFFVPQDLNIPLNSSVLGFDLMVPAFHLQKITLSLIMAPVLIEIIRNLLRLAIVARIRYAECLKENVWTEQQKYQKIKESIRWSFNQSKDDLIKFITFTTVLLLVFLLFPRLKLLTVAIASITTLFLDVVFPIRLTVTKGNDLISRIITKIFKL